MLQSKQIKKFIKYGVQIGRKKYMKRLSVLPIKCKYLFIWIMKITTFHFQIFHHRTGGTAFEAVQLLCTV